MNTSWQRAAVALAVVALGLTACGDEDEPTQSSSPTPTASASASSSAPSPSASASPSAPATAAADVPAAAKARTEAGALAFLDFYFDEFNRGLISPQNAPSLLLYADKGCVACKKSQALIDEYAKGGWSVKQAGMRVVRPALATSPKADKVLVNFTLEESSQPLYRNGQQTADKVPAATAKRVAALRWVSGTWQIFDFEAA